MKFSSHTIWIVSCVALLCSACGQKGRLVMPVRPLPLSTPYPTAVPTDNDGVSTPAPAITEQKIAPKPDSAAPEK